MALSFEDSLSAINEPSTTLAQTADNGQVAVIDYSLDDENDMVASYSLNDDGWILMNRFKYYTDYDDSNVSIVDDEKNVNVNKKQVNITRESNSQYIPFEMPRFYDGFDLTSVASIQIYFVNAEGYGSRSNAVNVYYNDTKIRFGWLVDANATAVTGKLSFEIQAIGRNSKGENYVWKTKPNDTLNVLKSLEANGEIVPDSDWITSFLTQVNEKVNEATAAANRAEAAIDTVQASADNAAESARQAQSAVDNAKTELTDSVQEAVNDKVATALANYYTKSDVYTKQEVDDRISNIDISDQLDEIKQSIANIDGLAKFNVTYDGKKLVFYNGETVIKEININSDPSDEWTNTYTAQVDGKIKVVSDNLANNYYTKTDSDSRYAASTSINGIESLANTNKSNIDTLSTKITELNEAVNGIDKSPRLTYDASYNTDGDYKFVLYEIENEGNEETEVRTEKASFVIQGGGGGGGGTSSVLKIEYVTTSPVIVTTNDKAIIKYNFSGVDSSGDQVTDGTATWRVGGRIIATNTAVSGENSFDVTEYLAIGTQKVNLSITDDAGSLVTKNWTVQKVDVRLESTFNDKIIYPIGKVAFDYTPYGAISKTVHFKVDGVEVGTVQTASSGIPMSYDIPAQTHGAHLLEAYITADINGNVVESNNIVKDIIWYDSNSDVPVIGCAKQEFTAMQYDATNIEYTVYDPSTENPTVTLAIDDNIISTLTLDSNTQVWQYKSSDVGAHRLTITCGETVKVINATIEKLDINIEPVTAGLEFDFNPSGRSNNDADRLWSYGDVTMTVSDNFDWVNGGYQIDENGDQYFCVKSGTTATVNYNLFADDPKKNGKEFKVVFKTTNVKNRATSFISCMDNNVGLDMKIENAMVYSSNGSLYSPYCEDDVIEFEFNINKDTNIPMVLTYEDGVGNRPMIYTSDSSFMQPSPKPITIGSEDCDVYIYRMKAYSMGLRDIDILSNFIADARSADEMISRYNRNQVYDENGMLTPEVLAEKCPDLRIIVIDAPWFTNDKSNKVEDTNITMIYKNGDPILDNWTCTGALHSGQGTSSNEYGYAGRNLDLIMDKDTSLFTLGDGKTTSKTITLTRDSVPTDYLNIKVNIASSENQNNAQMANRYNAYEPFRRSAKIKDNKVKDCMEFHNCVVFIRERNEDINTHREFQDTNVHYYGIGNVGDSKKTDDTRVNDKNDPNEFVVEIMDYNVALAEFPTGNGNDICPKENWIAGNTAYDYLYSPYKYKDGEFKSFGNESYEFRYEMKGITEEQREVNINAWRDMYKFVVTSTDEEFHSNLNKYFVVDSALYYYLFTERYTMVDNRAKNSFWHYGKAYYSQEEANEFATTYGAEIDPEYINDEQAAFNNGYRFDLTFGYDFDTSLGIDNTGKLVLTYGKEDTDFYVDDDPSSSYIYRAAESTFFCRLRDLFSSEMQAMFVDRENANAWSADSLINQWDREQSAFPEEIWRLDIQRKYLRTYQGVSIDGSIAGTANPRFLVEMMNGRKKYQRRMFERNQELYMATKYFGNRATQDQIMMRFNNPVGAVVAQDFTLYLTPYSDMYIGVKFGNVTPVNFRAKAGVEYTVPYSIDAESADITLIYGASFIQAIGDLSKCYVGDNDFSKASRLQRLVVGSDVEGYENTYMTKITLGSNKLLEYLDIKNVTGLNSVVDLSRCNNLLELHAEGSGATGVIFANGGKLKKAYVPSVVSITMKNLNNIEVFNVESYDNLQTLVVENTPFINTYNVVNSADKLNTVRLVGMDWNEDYHIEDTAILDRLLTMRGVDNDGYETLISMLSGKFHSSVIRQQKYATYTKTWKDLDITYNTMIEQYPVTFVNYDGTVLDVQYVDKGSNAVDPITRADNPIPVPTKESTVSTDFTFDAWDSSLLSIFGPRTITATYSESTRTYTVRYVSKGIVMQESSGLYGESIDYNGDTPTYTLEESAYKYYLFNRWDKSGYIDGDKTVNAIFDSFEYTSTAFDGKQLADLKPVEVYALTQLGIDFVNNDKVHIDVQDGDDYSFSLGYDIDYDDIESEVIVSEKTGFTGKNYIDTGIKLFDVDKDFVLAIDSEFLSGNTNNAVLAQCFQSNGSNGIKLWYNNGPRITWGTTSASGTSLSEKRREMLVIRHKKGSNNVTVYCSNLGSADISVEEITRTRSTVTDSTLVLGCAKADDGSYENYAVGNVYWCKVWYKDLGEEACKKLVCWTHENITMEVCGFKKYYLSDNPSKRCSFTLLAKHLLSRNMTYNSSYDYGNQGGWKESALNTFLNTRLYNAIPVQIKSLIKRVTVASSIGRRSSEIATSECYVYVPSVIEMTNESQYNKEPYINEAPYTISYMTSNEARKRSYDGGDYGWYWLRSPSVEYDSYIFCVNNEGEMYGYCLAPNEYGVLIEVSF